jgi:hypothetical protein
MLRVGATLVALRGCDGVRVLAIANRVPWWERPREGGDHSRWVARSRPHLFIEPIASKLAPTPYHIGREFVFSTV